MRKSYFKHADKIARHQSADLKSQKFQDYKYNQIDNPLRWYSLVQDCDK